MSNDPILKAEAEKKAKKLANKVSKRLQSLAKRIDKELSELHRKGDDKPVFALFVYTHGAAQYISNGDHPGVKQIVASVMSAWPAPEPVADMKEPTE